MAWDGEDDFLELPEGDALLGSLIMYGGEYYFADLVSVSGLDYFWGEYLGFDDYKSFNTICGSNSCLLWDS